MGRLFTGLLCLLAGFAQAHNLSVAHVTIDVPAASSPLIVEVDLALRDLALTLPLDSNHDESITWGELSDSRPELEALIATGLKLSSSAGACTLRPDAMATRRFDGGTYASVRLIASCPSRNGLQVRYDLFFDRDPQHRALVVVNRGSAVSSRIAKVDARLLDFRLPDSNPFPEFLQEGIRHILSGYDHLLFLVSLLLPAVLQRSGGKWQPEPQLRSSLWRVTGMVTAFTAAHSITLSLAALGLVTPISRWVEASIALSVVFAALNNVWPQVNRRLWIVAFAFGLVHGLGFAGALTEIGLPDGAQLLALLGFNAGVEVGQLSVILLLMPALYALGRRPTYPALVLRPASLCIAVVAGWWLVQRLMA